MNEEEIEKEILNCKICNVTKEKLEEYPLSSKDSFIFDNFCLHHKILIVKQQGIAQGRKDAIEEEIKFLKSVS